MSVRRQRSLKKNALGHREPGKCTSCMKLEKSRIEETMNKLFPRHPYDQAPMSDQKTDYVIAKAAEGEMPIPKPPIGNNCKRRFVEGTNNTFVSHHEWVGFIPDKAGYKGRPFWLCLVCSQRG